MQALNTPQQSFELAAQHHQAGRYAQAEAIYRQILSQDPNQVDALHMLGLLAHQAGQGAAAIQLIQRAIALHPNVAVFHANLGLVLAANGQLDAAITAYRNAVARQPDFVEAHYNLGNTFRQAGRQEEAIAEFRAALATRPNFPEALNNVGNALRETGRLEEAIAAFRQAISLRPSHAEALNNLGNALLAKDQLGEATHLFRQAVAARPNFIEALSSLGNALRLAGKLSESIAVFEQCVSVNPTYADEYCGLANALVESGKPDQAIAAYRKAIALRPVYPEALNNLGNVLRDKGELDAAIALYRQTLALRPSLADTHNNLGNALSLRGDIDDAMRCFQQAISLNPKDAVPHNNLGNALGTRNRTREAIACYRQAIQLRPDFAIARFNLAQALLLLGDFPQGWEYYDARSQINDFPKNDDVYRRPWDGSTLAGRSILLDAEQGLGDTIQFIRYVPILVAKGARVILRCPAPLERLLRGQLGIEQIIVDTRPLPPIDVFCPLLSLPRWLGTTLLTIPADVPYLSASAASVESWQRRLASVDGIKIGLAWAGSPGHQNDRNRSMRLESLAPLAGVPGVSFISLQKGPAAGQSSSPPSGMALIDWTDQLFDVAETAALIANLDLVITVDTAIAHLAGALGKPVWVLIPFSADWRWLLDRTDSPWYPTMRLFRQKQIGDWQTPISQVIAEVSKLTQTKPTQ